MPSTKFCTDIIAKINPDYSLTYQDKGTGNYFNILIWYRVFFHRNNIFVSFFIIAVILGNHSLLFRPKPLICIFFIVFGKAMGGIWNDFSSRIRFVLRVVHL